MPIRAENKDRYPKDWPAISLAVRAAAGNKCEWCGVQNYQLGGRTPDGLWLPAQPIGEKNTGLSWPKEGEHAWCALIFPNGDEIILWLRIVRIILTVAHLDHQPENCAPENLKALCQRCHNLYDAPMRRAGILERARKALGIDDLFERMTG